MSSIQTPGRPLDFNKRGYLARFEDWDRDAALQLAAEEGVSLTECHWKVIEFLRDYYATHQIPPSPRVVMQSIGHEISTLVPCTRKQFERLFPDGCKQACRIAGLPDYYCHGC